MLNPAIYRTIFNLDKDRKDLPAGNRAVPYQTASTGGDDLPAAPDIKPYMPIPKPPATRSKDQSPEVAPVELTAEETIDVTNEPDAGIVSGEQVAVTDQAPSASELGRGKYMPTTAEERQLRWARSQSPKTAKPGAKKPPSPTEIWQKQAAQAGQLNSQQTEELNGFFGENLYDPALDKSESAPGGIPPQLDRAARERQIQEQARAALGSERAEAPEELRPGTPKQLRRADEDIKYNEKLKAALRFENPRNANEKAQNRKAELQFKAQNPRNEDHGIKGFIKETLQNFFFGLSKAQGVPGISMGQALMLGGAGAGAGMLNRGWNEQRAAEGQLAGATQDVEFEAGQEKTRRTLDAQDASVGIRKNEQERKVAKDKFDADMRTKTFNWKKEDREAYLGLLEDRALYQQARDKKNFDLAQQRIDLLEKRYDSLERQGNARLVAQGKPVAPATTQGRPKPNPAQATAVLGKLSAAYQSAVDSGNEQAAALIKERIDKFKSENKLK